jgi:Flp pilus assembly protein TadG
MHILKQLYKARRGVAALEFALVSVPLLLLVFGTMEFGRLLWTQQALEMTAIEAARCVGILASPCSSGGAFSSDNTTSYIQSVASSWGITLTSANLAAPSGMVTRSSSDSNDTACAGLSEVKISYTFQTAVPGLLSMLSSNALQGHACFPNDS